MSKEDSIRNKIQNFVDKIIQDDNVVLGDILLNYTLCLYGMAYTKFKKHEEKFKREVFNRIISRTLRMKYPEIEQRELNNKIAQFIQFESRYIRKLVLMDSDISISMPIIENLSDYVFKKNLERLENISAPDIILLEFLFNKIYISLKNDEGGQTFSSYGFESGHYFYQLNTKEWSEDFNRVHNKSLREVNCFKSTYQYAKGSPIPNFRDQTICFWEFYDRLVELGFGYYVSWITGGAGQITIHFRMFKELYDNRKDFLSFIDVVQMSEEEIQEYINNCTTEREVQEGLRIWDVDPNSVQDYDLVEERRSRYIPSDVKAQVWKIYNGRCALCKSNKELHFDHIIPFSKGGSNIVENIQLLCKGCNLKKSDKIE